MFLICNGNYKGLSSFGTHKGFGALETKYDMIPKWFITKYILPSAAPPPVMLHEELLREAKERLRLSFSDAARRLR